MTIYYILVLLGAVMFSVQFLCQKNYQESNGTTMKAALEYSLYKGITVAVIMLFIGGFQLEFTSFSFWMAGLYAFCYILLNYFSFKMFVSANLSVYSVFAMLGGMILPFLTGILFFSEILTPIKLVCFGLVFVAVLFNVQKGTSGKKAFFSYMLVFVVNGTIGALATIHQNTGLAMTNSASFMCYTGLWSIVLSAIWLLLAGEKIPLFSGKNLLCAGGDGALCGVGDFLLLISVAPGRLDASLQYPFLTGGVVVFSTIISTLRKEPVRKNEYIAMTIALVAAILMAF